MFKREWSLYLLTTPQRYMGGWVGSPFSKALPSSFFTHMHRLLSESSKCFHCAPLFTILHINTKCSYQPRNYVIFVIQNLLHFKNTTRYLSSLMRQLTTQLGKLINQNAHFHQNFGLYILTKHKSPTLSTQNKVLQLLCMCSYIQLTTCFSTIS